MLMFLLLAHGWCILCRDMSRVASLRISAVVSTLYICLALNFLYAGNYWWVVTFVTLSAVGYSMAKIQGFRKDLAERMAVMQSEVNFQEIYTQVRHRLCLVSPMPSWAKTVPFLAVIRSPTSTRCSPGCSCRCCSILGCSSSTTS